MPRKLSNALTSLSVKNAKPGRYADGGGLYLLVKPTGARSWVYRFTLNGKTRDVGLGAAGTGGVTLSKARDHAMAMTLKVKAGTDPLAERDREAAEAIAKAQAARVAERTFRDEALAYLEKNEEGWRNPKHRQQWRNTLEAYAHPVIGAMPVSAIKTTDVLAVIEPIWKKKPETASRVRGRIETILDSAKAQGYREGENPARWRGHLEQVLPARTRLSRGHHKAIPYQEIPSFVSRLHQREAVTALALEFTLLTAARSGEVLGATWDEIDLDKMVWIIPANRMKAAKEHSVPLVARALAIIEGLRPLGSDWLFPASRGSKLSSMAMTMLMRRMQVDATVHGFRSGFRDWVAECTDHGHEVAEMALAHTIESRVEKAYRRGNLLEKRRALMSDWASYCASGGARDDGSSTVLPSEHG